MNIKEENGQDSGGESDSQDEPEIKKLFAREAVSTTCPSGQYQMVNQLV